MRKYIAVAADNEHFKSLVNTYKKSMIPVTTTPQLWELESKDGKEFITILTPKAAKDLGI